jgi:alanine dehydrogenase
VPAVAVLDHDAVLEAVSPADAIDRVREAFLRLHAGEWAMPAKVYLESAPYGDFRAMPARGDGLALLKWITSFPGNPARGCRR